VKNDILLDLGGNLGSRIQEASVEGPYAPGSGLLAWPSRQSLVHLVPRKPTV